jgi:hypothetical protein
VNGGSAIRFMESKPGKGNVPEILLAVRTEVNPMSSNELTWSCSKKRCGAQRPIARYDNISQSTSSHMGRDERKPKTHPWRKSRSRRCAMGSSLPYGGDTCWTRTSQSHTKDQQSIFTTTIGARHEIRNLPARYLPIELVTAGFHTRSRA